MLDLQSILKHLISSKQSKDEEDAPSLIQNKQNPLQALAQVSSSAASTPDPFAQAVQSAEQQYPWLKTLGAPIKLTTGSGPYMSESYDPRSDENPDPGNFTVQLRNPKLVNDPKQWPAALGREGMDYMARHDPTFQNVAQQFRQLMTPDQLQRSRNRYEKEQKTGEKRSFEDFMKGAELQEFIGGYVFDMPGWRDVKWTPEQRKLLNGLKSYMWQGKTPTPVNIQ